MDDVIRDRRTTLVFVGDSVTDRGRRDDRRHGLGRATCGN